MLLETGLWCLAVVVYCVVALVNVVADSAVVVDVARD